MSYLCALHADTPITHFCESCLDLVCEKCVSKQPHSGSNHIIRTIPEAAGARKKAFEEYIEVEINPIRSQCQKKSAVIGANKKQLERERKVIEKDIKIEFEALYQRLQSRQTEFTISKQTQIKHLQNFVHSIDDISSTFDSIFEDPYIVLGSYKNLDTQLKKLQSLNKNIGIMLADKEKQSVELERQCQATYYKSLTLPEYEQRNQFMNKLIQEFVKNMGENIQAANKATTTDLKNIEHTYNRAFMKAVSDQRAKFCPFCNQAFTLENVNEQCSNNRSAKINCADKTQNWEELIPAEFKGTRRHFWYQADLPQRKRPAMEGHLLMRKAAKKLYWNSLAELETVRYLIKQVEIETGTAIGEALAEDDPSKTGYVSKVAFIYTLNRKYGISKNHIEAIIQQLQTQKGIDYIKFKQLLSQPTQKYQEFVRAQEQFEKSKPVAAKSSISPSSYPTYRRNY